MTEQWIEPGEQFGRLFTSVDRWAWRWECQTVYRSASEAEPLRRWREGLPDDLRWMRPWLDMLREATESGKRFARVRVFPEPPTEYLRWQSALTTPHNIAAGEDIRVITAAQARELGLPGEDFWLFDDARVVWLHFGDDHALTGATLTDDPATVSRCRAWRDLAVRHAVPFEDYAILRST